MSNQQMPLMNDTLDFVKNLWGSMGVPGIATPTLSVDELDKKISDLKAVEAWLSLNSTMLRNSIQALEVQRNTIATLKSMGETMAHSMQQAGSGDKSLFDTIPYASAFFQQAEKPKASEVPEPPKAPPAPDPATAASAQMANPAAWWNMLQDQFAQAVTKAMAADNAVKPQPTPEPEAPPKPKRKPAK